MEEEEEEEEIAIVIVIVCNFPDKISLMDALIGPISQNELEKLLQLGSSSESEDSDDDSSSESDDDDDELEELEETRACTLRTGACNLRANPSALTLPQKIPLAVKILMHSSKFSKVTEN